MFARLRKTGANKLPSHFIQKEAHILCLFFFVFVVFELFECLNLECAHAAGDAKGGEDGGQDGDDGLNDEFPSFFVHGCKFLS